MPHFTILAAKPTAEMVLGSLLVALLLASVVILLSLPWLAWFQQELKYINTEIERNEGNTKEQARWKRRKKRLWLSILPGRHYE